MRVEPASDAQTMFWLQDLRSPRKLSANINGLMRVDGDFDAERFRRALGQFIGRHEVFRTSFEWSNDGLTQVIHDALEPPVTTVGADGDAQLEALVSRLNGLSFRMESAPLLRITLIERSGCTDYVHLSVHHSIYDLHTQRLLRSEIEALYGGGQLDPVPVQYAEFGAAEREWKHGNDAQRQRGYWSDVVGSIPPLAPLPGSRESLDHPTEPEATSAFFHADPGFTARVRDYVSDKRSAPFLVIGALFAIAIAESFGLEDFAVGVPLTNRRNSLLADVAGCCMNVLPVHWIIRRIDTFESLLASFRRMMLLAHRNQELSVLEIAAQAGRPVYQFGFTFDEPLDFNLEGCRLQPRDCPRGGALALFVHFYEDSSTGAFRARADYARDEIDRGTVERVFVRMQEMTGPLLDYPKEPIGSLR